MSLPADRKTVGGELCGHLEGWQRLQERGYFEQPTSSQDAINQLYDLGSPVGAFIRDCCNVGPGLTVECGVLFGRWKEWCSQQGRDRPGTTSTFSRDLRGDLDWITMKALALHPGR